MDVVVLIRHPAAFAASLKRLGWKHSFATFIQDGGVPEVVRPYEAEIREQAERPGETMAQAALLWRLLYNAVYGYRDRHPDWAFVRHEDASAEPVATFERLYAQLGLDFTPAAREAIARASCAGKPGRAGDAVRGRARQRRQPRPVSASSFSISEAGGAVELDRVRRRQRGRVFRRARTGDRLARTAGVKSSPNWA